MTPADLTIAQLLGKPTPKVEWLLSVRLIAKKLNEESTRDGRAANNCLPTNHGD